MTATVDARCHFNRGIQRLSEARMSVMTHAFSSAGCFTGIRARWNPEQQRLYLFRPREHVERLTRSARAANRPRQDRRRAQAVRA